MQASQEEKVAPEVLESVEYKIIQSTIEELSKAIMTIEEGMNSEFAQARTLNKILDSQLGVLRDLSTSQIVSMDHIKTLKGEYFICLEALSKKADLIKTLNAYLNDRMRQMNILRRKRLEIIKKYTPAQVIEFKKARDEED